MKIRLRRIVRREGAVLDRVFLVRVARHSFPGQEIRVSAGPHLFGVDRFSVEVIGRFFAHVERHAAIDADMTLQIHRALGRVVLREIRVNIGIAEVDCDIVARSGEAVFVMSSGRWH